MIIILCDSYKEAEAAFEMFLDFIDEVEPWNIKTVEKASLCIEMADDLRYIFIDYRMKGIFSKLTLDFMEEDEFFENLGDYCGITYPTDVDDYYLL